MDIELLKTFLAVDRSGQFGRAADSLYLTPAAVSARIRQLEGMVGVPLFVRNRSNVTLTPAGERLKPYAESILEYWGLALQEASLSEHPGEELAIGGTPNLWDLAVQDYLHRLRTTFPGLALRAECHDSAFLTSQLLARRLDIALLFDPLKVEEVAQERLFSIALNLFAAEPGIDAEQAYAGDYIQVAWSIGFSLQHQRITPRALRPVLSTSTGRIALDFLLLRGGAAYLPNALAEFYVGDGRLFQVEDAPEVSLDVYAIYRRDNRRGKLASDVINLLKQSKPVVAPTLRT
jgi:DNA-binding transcriptional LysR family regulator